MASELIPISDEQAKAIQEGLKLGTTSLETARALGGYLARVLGTVPEDIVGLLGGDWLRLRRVENAIGMMKTARRINADRGVKEEPAPLSVALPLLEFAADEDREPLVDLWARLLAAALDPAKRNAVRRRFIEIVKEMEPLDAAVFLETIKLGGTRADPSMRECFAQRLDVSPAQIEVSMFHLVELGCARNQEVLSGPNPAALSNIHINSLGQELYRILRV